MNRREFCQTTALLFAGSIGAGVSLRSEERMPHFRAQKVFLESWDTESDGKNSQHTVSFVRKKLELIRREDFNGLILIPGCRGTSGWEEKIATEADRFDLKIFVPTDLPCEFFSSVQTTVPLLDEAGVLQSIDGKAADNGGFLLLNDENDVLGLVLYDSSRCLWTVFALPGIGFVRDSRYSANDSRLMTARWLDRAQLCFSS